MSRPLRGLAAALLAAFAFAAPAAAQDKIRNIPAEKYLIAPGGVDMRTGRYAYSATDLAGGEGALALTRILPETVGHHANPFGNFSHNWDIFLIEMVPPTGADDVVRANVHYGGRSLTFETRASVEAMSYAFKSDGPLATLTYSGSRATGSAVHMMTAPDGTAMTFRPLGSADCADQAWGSGRRRCAFVSQMVQPDGTRFTFDYVAAAGSATGNLARLARVTSSRGYALLLEGGGSTDTRDLVVRACLFNLALGPAPAPGSACPANALATSSYAYAGRKLVSATAPGGGQSTFEYPDPGTVRFVKPGQPAWWLTNMVAGFVDEEGADQEVVASQAFADGQTYSYAWGLAPIVNDQTQPFPTANTVPNIAGGSYTDADGRETRILFDWPLHPNSGPTQHCAGGGGCELDPPWDDFLNWSYQQTPGPVEIVDPLGHRTAIDYCDPAASGGCSVTRMQSSTDPEGIETRYDYDGRGNIRKATRTPRPGIADPDGSAPAPIVLEAEYDVANVRSQTKPLWTRDANGNTARYAYWPEHGGVRTETGPAVGGISPQKRYGYVLREARRWDGSPAGPGAYLLDRMAFCRSGNPAPAEAGCALGPSDEVVTRYEYGPASGPNLLLLRGQSVTSTDSGIVTTLRTCYAYDALGRRISETSPLGVGAAACPAAPPTSALPYTTSTRYDPDGRVTGTIGPDPDGAGGNGAPAVRNSYDPAGRLIRVEQGALAAWQDESVSPSAWTGFAVHRIVDAVYDPLDRKVKESVSGTAGGAPLVQTVTEYRYDRSGRLECTAVRMNPAEYALAPRDACRPGTAHAIWGADRISRNVYDPAGRLVAVKEGVGTPLERTEASYTYNANDQRTSLTDARGYRAEMHYDGHGRQSRWLFPSKSVPGVANPGDYEQYRYDPNGNRTKLRKRDGSELTFRYDALNRMTAKLVPERADLTLAQTRDVFYDYDLRGLQTKARFDGPAGPGIANAYDGFGRLVSTWTDMDGTSRRLSSEYDADGRRVTLWDNGVSYSGKYGYDGLGRMAYYLEGFGPTAFQIFYDNAGRRSRVELGVGGVSSTLTYGYDLAGRLSALNRNLAGNGADQSVTFASTPASQIETRYNDNILYAWTRARAADRPYSVNGLNQYSAAGEATFGYDPNGNLTSVTNPPETTTYLYDVENRLVSASGAQTATLSYDPLGRLWQVSAPTGTTRFLYDGDELIQEFSGTGVLLRDYDHADGADEPLMGHEYFPGGYTRSFLHADQQGSIVAITDTNGVATAINTYDEYGIPGAGNQGRFQYTGQAWIGELGLYYYKARFYSPTLGRFLQIDPIGYEGGVNLYAYVDDDPVNRTDPTGKQGILPARPFDSDWVADKKQEIRETITRATWEAEKKGFWLLANLTSLAFGPEGQVGQWAASKEAMSAAARAFQISQGGRAGEAFVVNGVKFDGYAGGTLIEAKSRYDTFVKNGKFYPWFKGTDALVEQALRQLRAVDGRARIEWRVQGARAAQTVRDLFLKNGIKGINVRTVSESCTGSRLCGK